VIPVIIVFGQGFEIENFVQQEFYVSFADKFGGQNYLPCLWVKTVKIVSTLAIILKNYGDVQMIEYVQFRSIRVRIVMIVGGIEP
jgi:hypothetical protein